MFVMFCKESGEIIHLKYSMPSLEIGKLFIGTVIFGYPPSPHLSKYLVFLEPGWVGGLAATGGELKQNGMRLEG